MQTTAEDSSDGPWKPKSLSNCDQVISPSSNIPNSDNSISPFDPMDSSYSSFNQSQIASPQSDGPSHTSQSDGMPDTRRSQPEAIDSSQSNQLDPPFSTQTRLRLGSPDGVDSRDTVV